MSTYSITIFNLALELVYNLISRMNRDIYKHILLLLSLVITTQSNYITAGRWLDDFALGSSEETPKLVKHSLALPAGSEVSFYIIQNHRSIVSC